MRDLIKESYGQTDEVTWTFDRVQIMEECCGVEDHTWGIYKSSNWYSFQPGLEG